MDYNNVVATANCTLNGENYIFFFMEGGAVFKYNMNSQFSTQCTNLHIAIKQGDYNISNVSGAIKLGSFLRTLGIIR